MAAELPVGHMDDFTALKHYLLGMASGRVAIKRPPFQHVSGCSQLVHLAVARVATSDEDAISRGKWPRRRTKHKMLQSRNSVQVSGQKSSSHDCSGLTSGNSDRWVMSIN